MSPIIDGESGDIVGFHAGKLSTGAKESFGIPLLPKTLQSLQVFLK
jgi:hypothetical protein